MTVIVQTIRSDTPEMRPRLPTPWSCAAGERVKIEYKRSGQVVFVEQFECVEYITEDGDSLKRWEPQ